MHPSESSEPAEDHRKHGDQQQLGKQDAREERQRLVSAFDKEN
jgi:hypothetical protein